MIPLAALTTAELFASLQAAVFAALGIAAILGSVWAAIGRGAYRRIVGWFEKLEKRFDTIDERQAEAQIEREVAGRAAVKRDTELLNKLDNLTVKMDSLATTVSDHHAVLYGSGSRAGLIEEVAFFRGREQGRKDP